MTKAIPHGLAASLGALALAACGGEEAQQAAPETTAETETAPAETREMPDEVAQTEFPGLDPALTEPESIERLYDSWAVSAEACAGADWVITQDSFTTGRADFVCNFEESEVAGRVNRSGTASIYTIAAECLTEEDAETRPFTFTLSADGDILYVSSTDALDVTLQRCSVLTEGLQPAPEETAPGTGGEEDAS